MKKENKKTIFITIIGVLILVALVIGSTFAYFLVTGSNTTTNTGIQTTAEDVGFVTLSGGSTLHIRLTANDMANTKIGTSYYATASNENYATTEENIEIAKATVVGGSDTTTYNCTFNLNTVVDGTMVENLREGDAKIVYSGIINLEEDLTNVTSPKNVSVSLTGKDATNAVNAYVVFNNTANNQIDLAGKSLNITITPDNFSCDTNTSVKQELSDEAKALAATIAASEVGDTFDVKEYYSEENYLNASFILLAKEDNKALVLYSQSGGAGGYGLASAFDTNGNADWSNSSLRTYLNSDFLSSKPELSELLLNTTVYTRSSSNIDEYITTTDKIFIMSEADRLGTIQGNAVSYEDSPKDYTIAPDSDGNILPDSVIIVASGWRFEYDYMWLRTPGVESGKVRYADTRTANTVGEDVPTNKGVVYPIMWVDISSAS